MAEPRTDKAEPKAKRPKEPAGKVGPRKQAALVRKVMRNIEARLKKDELKPTIGDFIRLVELKKELDEEQPKEIKVTWVEPDEKANVSEA